MLTIITKRTDAKLYAGGNFGIIHAAEIGRLFAPLTSMVLIIQNAEKRHVN